VTQNFDLAVGRLHATSIPLSNSGTRANIYD